MLFNMFEHSVIQDQLDDYINPEAIAFIQNNAWYYHMENKQTNERIVALPDTFAASESNHHPPHDRCLIKLRK